MTKIDIFSGFLGAGKTTLIKKLIKEAYTGEKLVLIENEFGEIGIDGGFLTDAGVEITEMNSGCICCSLVGDFGKALRKVLDEFHPDRILIEPSGVGKLSDVIKAVRDLNACDAELGGFTTVADVNKCKMYIKNFGEFFCDQIKNAACIVLSRTDKAKSEKIEEAVALLRAYNEAAPIITTPWDELDGKQMLSAMERDETLKDELARLANEAEHNREHHHDDECDCHGHSCEHHHHHDDECDCHEHSCEHHHHHDDECDCHEHSCEHHHHHDDECDCHGHHSHEHHHADEVFSSWGVETPKKFSEQEITAILKEFASSDKYGMILRAKGFVESSDDGWIYFDYVPGEFNVRSGSASVTGRLCVIGSKLDEYAIAERFGV